MNESPHSGVSLHASGVRAASENAENCVLLQSLSDGLCFFGIADGQHGGRRAAEGGGIGLSALGQFLRDFGTERAVLHPFPDELPYLMVRPIREALAGAAAENADLSDYGSSLLAASVDPRAGVWLVCCLGIGAAFGVRRDGSVFRLCPGNAERGISPPPLTVSENAISHLRLSFGTVDRCRRLLLLSDRSEKLCCGSRLSTSFAGLLAAAPCGEVMAHLRTHARGRCACVLIELPAPERG